MSHLHRGRRLRLWRARREAEAAGASVEAAGAAVITREPVAAPVAPRKRPAKKAKAKRHGKKKAA